MQSRKASASQDHQNYRASSMRLENHKTAILSAFPDLQPIRKIRIFLIGCRSKKTYRVTKLVRQCGKKIGEAMRNFPNAFNLFLLSFVVFHPQKEVPGRPPEGDPVRMKFETTCKFRLQAVFDTSKNRGDALH
jgi:hypothetical protein